MSIDFECPHCGARTDVAEQFVGRSGPCGTCGKPITVPPPPAPAAAKRPRSRRPLTGFVLLFGVAGAILCGLLVLVLATVFQPPAGGWFGRRIDATDCAENLEKIGRAMNAYVEDKGHFPPGCTLDRDGKPQHSWRVLLLPYLGYQSLYDRYHFDEPWDSPHNMELSVNMPDVYQCPYAVNAAANETSYLVVHGDQLAFHRDQKRTPAEFRDGRDQTVVVVEVTGMSQNWLDPEDLSASQIPWDVNANLRGLGSHHAAGGMHVLTADGAVHHLNDFVTPAELHGLMTVSGDEPVRIDQW